MRRKDKEISDEAQIKAVIKKSNVCRLGMVSGNEPYIVPLSFGYRGGILYFYGALNGRKIDIIRENPKVCFEFDLLNETVKSENACEWSMRYQSVIGFGKAFFIESLEAKRNAMSIIMGQYSDRSFELPENMLKATAVFKVEIDSLTGKQSGF